MSEPGEKSSEILDAAEKARHAFLLEKVLKGKALTERELKELKRLEGVDTPGGLVDTQDEIAKAFGVSVRQVGNWIRDGMPRTPDGRYSLPDIYQWKMERDRKAGRGANDELTQHEATFRQYRAASVKLDYMKKLGELVSIEQVNRERVERIMIVKKALLALPSQLAPQVIGLEVKKAEALMRKRIEAIINDFAAGGDGLITEPEAATPTPETPATSPPESAA